MARDAGERRAEKLITGNENSARDKFQAWAKTVPKTLRNPLFHWTHLELQRYFGIEKLLEESTAQEIWDETTRCSNSGLFRARPRRANEREGDLHFGRPADLLEYHKAIKKSSWKVKVFPASGPTTRCASTSRAVQEVGESVERRSGMSAGTFKGFLKALKQQHDSSTRMAAGSPITA